MSDQRDYALGARNVKVFTTQSETLGLPSMVFSLGLMIAIAVFVMFSQNGGFLVGFVSGLLVCLIYYPFMYLMHREDPNGFEVWRRSVAEKEYWLAGSAADRSLEIIPKKQY